MILRVEDALRVVVGEVYDVPCVEWGGHLTPVLHEHPHADPDLGVAVEHFHYDLRFLTEWEIRRLTLHLLGCDRPAEDDRAAMLVVERWREGKAIRRADLPCLREMPAFPSEVASWYAGLVAAYAGKRWRGGCRACPHRGTLLLGVKAVRGVVTCPAHGLRLDARTGDVLG